MSNYSPTSSIRSVSPDYYVDNVEMRPAVRDEEENDANRKVAAPKRQRINSEDSSDQSAPQFTAQVKEAIRKCCFDVLKSYFPDFEKTLDEKIDAYIIPHIPVIQESYAARKTKNCLFCRRRNHESSACRTVSKSADRRKVMKERDLCLRCLEPNNRPDGVHYPCPKAVIVCSLCQNAYHDPMICENRDDKMNHCIFCNSDSHVTKRCRKNSQQRRLIIQRQDLCVMCLEPGFHDLCPLANRECEHCSDIYKEVSRTLHHPLLCEAIDVQKPISPKCEFCRTRGHSTLECRKLSSLSSKDAIDKLTKENRCLQCFQPKNHRNCLNDEHICQHCSEIYKDIDKAQHHPLLCEDAQKTGPIKTSRRGIPRGAPYRKPTKKL